MSDFGFPILHIFQTPIQTFELKAHLHLSPISHSARRFTIEKKYFYSLKCASLMENRALKSDM